MATKAPVPAFVKALPAPIRTMLLKQCAGDWRRVTRNADGGIVVHNNPQIAEPETVAEAEPPPVPPVPPVSPVAEPDIPRGPTPALMPKVRPGFPQHPPGFEGLYRHGIYIKPRTEPMSRKRSGRPRTAVEFTKRILDMGGQFQRLPESPKMRVFFMGYYLGEVWCADNTPKQMIRRQYWRVRTQIEAITAFFAD